MEGDCGQLDSLSLKDLGWKFLQPKMRIFVLLFGPRRFLACKAPWGPKLPCRCAVVVTIVVAVIVDSTRPPPPYPNGATSAIHTSYLTMWHVNGRVVLLRGLSAGTVPLFRRFATRKVKIQLFCWVYCEGLVGFYVAVGRISKALFRWFTITMVKITYSDQGQNPFQAWLGMFLWFDLLDFWKLGQF